MYSYKIISCVSASFSQSSDRFQPTGSQCTCITLYGICFSVFKSVSTWNKKDLDYVIENGDRLYKLQNTSDFLSCPDLPRSLKICDVMVTVNFDINLFDFLSDSNSKLLLIRNLHSTLVFSGILFLINGFSFSIISVQNFYYIVDSHSRNTLGQPSPFGVAVVLKFENIVEVVNYIFDIYHHTDSTQYEIQFLHIPTVSISNDIKKIVLRNYKLEYRPGSTKRSHSENKFCDDKVDKNSENEVCNKKVKNYEKKLSIEKVKLASSSSSQCDLSTDRPFSDRINAFREKITEGPFYIYVICNRCLYRKSVKKISIL